MKLRDLATLQKLRERKCESAAGAARQRTLECEATTKILASKQALALRNLAEVTQSPELCLDRMMLAIGQFNHAESSLAMGRNQLVSARDDEAAARDLWQQACFKSDDIARQARQATRREIRHREDTLMIDRQSLAAAIKGG